VSFNALLRHTVTIERPYSVPDGGEPALDEYGQPIHVPVELGSVMGLVQPRSALSRSTRELPSVSEAGTVISDHVVYLPIGTDIAESDRIVHGGRTYEVQLVRDAAGHGHHLEVDVRLVRSPALSLSVSS